MHVSADWPFARPDTTRTVSEDLHLRIADCQADAQAALLAVPLAARGTIADARCTSLDGVVVARVREAATDASRESSVRALLEQTTEALRAGRSFRIADARSDVPHDATWLAGAAFTPWQVARAGDLVTASGVLLFERTWYRFAVRIDEHIALEAAPVALANTHGDPP